MDISVEAGVFRDVLKRFKPKTKRVALSKDYVRATAGGGVLVLIGSYENSASLSVEVHAPGSANLPLEPALGLVKTCKAKDIIRIRTDGDSVWIGPTNFPGVAGSG